MPRQSRPWFRFYVEAFGDRKMLRLTPSQRWVWVAVLGAARESPVPGRLVITEDVPMTVAELARFADVREKDVAMALDVMVRLGMVTVEDGVVVVTNWGVRQFESDDVTARTRDHRERSNPPPKEQRRDVPTPVPTNVRRNAPDTETETETTKTPSSAAADAAFDAFWQAYPRKVGKQDARKVWDRKIRDTDPTLITDGVRRYLPVWNGTQPEFIPHPSTWLQRGSWDDEILTAAVGYNPNIPEGWL